jgi:outer membrane protein assembly factor BamB
MKWLMCFLCIWSLGCKSDDLVEVASCNIVEVENESEYQVIWQKPLLVFGGDTLSSRSIDPIIYNDKIIHGSLPNIGQNSETFYLRDAEDGTKEWEWNDDSFGQTPFTRAQYIDTDNFVLSNGLGVYVIDILTGQKKWNTSINNPRPRIDGFDNQIFYTSKSSSLNPDTCRLIYSDVNTSDWKTILTFSKQDDGNYAPGIEPPISWQNDDNETILFFQNRSYNFSIGDGKIDLYAYNLDQELIEWQHLDVEENGNSSIFKPILYDDKVFFQGAKSIFCYNIKSGDLLWKKTFGSDGLLTCNSVIAEDKIILNGTLKHVYALNLETGDLIWDNEDASSENSGNMVYYKDHVYFISEGNGKLYGVNTLNGETILEMDSPNDTGSNGVGFKSGIVINPNLNYLYASDNYFFMCIKLLD